MSEIIDDFWQRKIEEARTDGYLNGVSTMSKACIEVFDPKMTAQEYYDAIMAIEL